MTVNRRTNGMTCTRAVVIQSKSSRLSKLKPFRTFELIRISSYYYENYAIQYIGSFHRFFHFNSIQLRFKIVAGVSFAFVSSLLPRTFFFLFFKIQSKWKFFDEVIGVFLFAFIFVWFAKSFQLRLSNKVKEWAQNKTFLFLSFVLVREIIENRTQKRRQYGNDSSEGTPRRKAFVCDFVIHCLAGVWNIFCHYKTRGSFFD